MEMLALSDLLGHIRDHAWNDEIYLPPGPPWREASPCIVLDHGARDDPEEIPPIASRNGLTRVVSVANARSIVENAKLQLGQVTPRDLIESFNYYFANDAFIDFEEQSRRLGR